jgi:hypothetical protein
VASSTTVGKDAIPLSMFGLWCFSVVIRDQALRMRQIWFSLANRLRIRMISLVLLVTVFAKGAVTLFRWTVISKNFGSLWGLGNWGCTVIGFPLIVQQSRFVVV